MMVYTMMTACLILVCFCFSMFVASCSMKQTECLHSLIPLGFSSPSESDTDMGISLHPNPFLSGQFIPAYNCISVKVGFTPLDSITQLRDALPWWRNASFHRHCRHLQLWVRSRERKRLGELVWEDGRGDSETAMEIKYSKSFTGLKNLRPKQDLGMKCFLKMISDI